LFILSVFILSYCEKESTGNNPQLLFSSDTVHFDTVFASIGSTTRELRVRNPGRSRVRIDEIRLAGGANSPYRLNIDGSPGYFKPDVTIEGYDSIFIFIDVIIDPLSSDSPVSVTDSIMFSVSGTALKVQLLAWGQDINLIDNSLIKTETWSGAKPYVVYGALRVDTLDILTIEKGTRVLFHRNSSMTVAGRLVVNGTFGSPVLFASDRTEIDYEDVPGQWTGVNFLNTSTGNVISHLLLRNSVTGITVGEPVTAGITPQLSLAYSDISHSSVSALAAVNADIEAENSVFSHCGRNCIVIRAGGEYSFTHCTAANFWDYGFRQTPAVSVSEKPVFAGGTYGQLHLTVNNSVLTGDRQSELEIIPVSGSLTGSYFFDHCLVTIDTVHSSFWDRSKFPYAVISRNPGFISQVKYDFRPDTLSPVIDNGNNLYAASLPADFRNYSRLLDGKPDIGAFERKPGDKAEK
jgi:hypothetical protein